MALSLMLAGLAFAGSLAPSAAQPPQPEAAPAELVIRLESGGGWITVDVAPYEDAAHAIERLALTPGVSQVARNNVFRLHAIPNDPLFEPLQWNLPAIGWPAAWEQGDGTGVVVAVLDSGVGLGGDDLDCRTFVHPYNSATGEAGLAAATDVDGHGTHVIGTVAQCTDNGFGVAGVAPGVSIMPVKVGVTGSITSASVANGISWAVAHGADVINLSLGMPCQADWPACRDVAVDTEIAAAVAAGVLVVASTGNDSLGHVDSPANHPAALAVGATTVGNAPAAYSNDGSDLDLMAPGGTAADRIYQETFNCPGAGYVICGFFGTSMAAPHVAGAAALLLSVVPDATAAEVRSALTTSALDLGSPGWDETSGAGLIQVDDAIAALMFPCPAGASCDTTYLVSSAGLWQRWHRLTTGSPVDSFYYGNPGDIAFSGDWDCDGDVTPGLYRQSDGFVYLRNSATEGTADVTFFFGNPGDVPIAGDFDGDGCDTVSVYRPSEGRFFIIDELGADGGGLGAAGIDYLFGDPGDQPFAGDFDGDGVATIGLHRAATGLVYFRNSHTTGIADAQFVYGDPGDRILAGDWDGDGDDTVAAYRPGNGHLYVKLANTAGLADVDLFVGYFDQAARSQA